MIFYIGSKQFGGSSAVEVTRKIEGDCAAYHQEGGTVRDFISWSLLQLEGQLPRRELAVSDHVSDETLAFSYLCLLDRYGLGELDCLTEANQHHPAKMNVR
ncbi:MAG: hypothetical protein AB1757_20880 [Acidobacteriota bacterium]